MANGDAASAAGMDVVAGTADLRLGYDEENKTRDYLAVHQTAGTHPASAINSGTFDAARIPALDEAKVARAGALRSGAGDFYWDGAAWISDGVLAAVGNLIANAQIQAPAVYPQSVAGMGGFRSLNVAANGIFGGITSSARYKEEITAADIPRETLRALRPRFYRYIALTEADEPLQLSFIAEDVHVLGLTWLVDYDDEGRPDGLNERAVPYLALLLAQDDADRIDDLEATGAARNRRITELENRLTAFEKRVG